MLDKAIIGEAIVRLRGHRSQRALAKRAGVPAGTWCGWEKGKRRPRDAQIAKLLKGLDCTEDDLTVMIWKVTGEKLKLKGSEAVPTARKALEDHQLQIAALLRESSRRLPEDLRPVLVRLDVGLRDASERLAAVQSDLEALILALGRPR